MSILSAKKTTAPKSISVSWGIVLTGICLTMILVGHYLALVFAPESVNLTTAVERFSQRILYIHVGAAWGGFFPLLATCIAGIVYLITRRIIWDDVALASAEIGLCLMTIFLVTGSVWARPTWNVWWTWSPRVTISAISWLMYVGYLMLRGAIDDPERTARFASIYGIIAFISVPINYMAIRWWRDIHPTVVGSGASEGQGGFAMGNTIRDTLLFWVVIYTVFYTTMLYHRLKLAKTAREVELLKRRLWGI
ncbi:MAG: cytochrome c biogenesis protein CcsA [Chloroflexota bacterium]